VVALQNFAHEHATTFDMEEEEHKHEYMQAHLALPQGFESKLEVFLLQHNHTGEQLVELVARDGRKRVGRQRELHGQDGQELGTGNTVQGGDVVDVMLASFEYDVFIEMIRIAHRRAAR
jgi:hypothetical protein